MMSDKRPEPRTKERVDELVAMVNEFGVEEALRASGYKNAASMRMCINKFYHVYDPNTPEPARMALTALYRVCHHEPAETRVEAGSATEGVTPDQVVDAFFRRLDEYRMRIKQLEEQNAKLASDLALREKEIRYYEEKEKAEIQHRRASVAEHIRRLMSGPD
jgi:hypothetical protein